MHMWFLFRLFVCSNANRIQYLFHNSQYLDFRISLSTLSIKNIIILFFSGTQFKLAKVFRLLPTFKCHADGVIAFKVVPIVQMISNAYIDQIYSQPLVKVNNWTRLSLFLLVNSVFHKSFCIRRLCLQRFCFTIVQVHCY